MNKRIRINFENLISKCSTVLNELEYSKLFSHRFEDRFITELKLKNFLQTQFRLNKLKINTRKLGHQSFF